MDGQVAGFATLDSIVQHCLTEAGGDVHKAIQLAKLYVVGAEPFEEAVKGIAIKSIEAATASGVSLDDAIAELFAGLAASEVVDKLAIEDIIAGVRRTQTATT